MVFKPRSATTALDRTAIRELNKSTPAHAGHKVGTRLANLEAELSVGAKAEVDGRLDDLEGRADDLDTAETGRVSVNEADIAALQALAPVQYDILGADFTRADAGAETIEIEPGGLRRLARFDGGFVLEGASTEGDLSALTISIGIEDGGVDDILAAESMVAADEGDTVDSDVSWVEVPAGKAITATLTPTGDTLDDVPDGHFRAWIKYRPLPQPE